MKSCFSQAIKAQVNSIRGFDLSKNICSCLAKEGICAKAFRSGRQSKESMTVAWSLTAGRFDETLIKEGFKHILIIWHIHMKVSFNSSVK